MADNSDLGKKVLIAGHGGKSTLAQAVAADLDLPYVELDALSHQPNWVETPKDEFRELVNQVLVDNPDGWVIDGNYANDLQGMVAEQADTIVYVDMPYTLMMWRVFWRSVARLATRNSSAVRTLKRGERRFSLGIRCCGS